MSTKAQDSVRIYLHGGKKRAEVSRLSLTTDFDAVYDEVLRLLQCKHAVIVEDMPGYVYYQAADGE